MRPATPENSAALLDGVVISPRQGVAYVMRSGGIDALNLATGKLRWRSDKAAKPLALVGDRLIAQVDGSRKGSKALELVVLDARSGASRDSIRIPLPQGVVATVVDTPAGSFRVRTESTASELVVSWEVTGLEVGAQGYVASADDGQAPGASLQAGVQVMTGQALLDMTSQSLSIKAEPSVRLAQSASIVRSGMEELSSPAVSGIEGRQLLSADGRHVLVTETVESADPLYRHRWTMYERSSGARLGSVPALVSATPFVVIGTTLYHTVPAYSVRKDGKFVEHPTSLRAVNLNSGVEVWKTALLETSFRGPFPP
jgi:outer membrane protein assembly factor BamB